MQNNLADNFLKLVDSLRRHQRAEEFNEDNENIIEHIYTDPFEGEFVLKSMLLPQSTILIGRKGTGKSTIIGRFQHEIRKSTDKVSLYLDVKTIYEQATGGAISTTPEIDNIMNPRELQRYFLYKHFIKSLISEIEKEISKNVFTNRFIKFFSSKGLTEEEFKKEILDLFSGIENPKYEDITAIKEIKTNSENSNKSYKDATSNFGSSLEPKVKVSIEDVNVEVGKVEASYKRKTGSEESNLNSENYSTVFIRYFNIYEFINRIKLLLEKVGIKIVYLCLDDASELEKEALDIFVRTLVVPFNNTSSGFFKFKISFYPGRDHLPGIDRTKIETINLDYYYLYQATGVDKVEENAINYTKRLLERRINYFLGSAHTLDDVFEIRSSFSINDYYRIIFQVTANVTRLIGKLLWYAAKRSIFSGNKITKRVLQESSKEHYEQEIETILTKSEYIQYKNYNERFEREHLKILLDKIVQKAKDAKKQIGVSTAEIFKEYNTNNAPSNYLYFPPYMEDALATLELNFFISKFTQQRDRGIGTGSNYVPPKDVSVYTLNYGLCQKENIIVDEKSDRKFRIERVFDYSDLISEWIKSSKIIKCTICNTTHSINKLEAIKQFDMLCSVCHNNSCRVESIEYELQERAPVKIKEKDFQVLNTLKIENGLSSPKIAQELDVSYQSINQRIRIDRFLSQSNYIEKREIDGVNKYFITENALSIFFDNIIE